MGPWGRLRTRKQSLPAREAATSAGATGRSAHPGRLAVFWIRLVNRSPFWTYVCSSLVVFVLLLWVASATGIKPNYNNALTAFLVAALSALFSFGVPLVITVAALRRPLRFLLRIVAQATSGSRTPVLAFLGDTLNRMQDNLVQLRGEGATLEAYEVAAWVRRCFKAADGQYVGTDSHLPSLYSLLYRDYLPAHEEYLRKTTRKDSIRIMLVDIERLRTDRTDAPEAFAQFTTWHSGHPVALMYLRPRDNDVIVSAPDLKPSLNVTDIGFWRDNFVLLFSGAETNGSESPSPTVHLRIAFKGEPVYAKCEVYVNRLLEATGHETDEPKDLSADLPIYSGELSQHWRLFCDPERRLRQTGAFLESVLSRFDREPRQIKVFDAAAGIGIEAVYLIQKGYFVVANEIEPALRKAAQSYARELGVILPESHFYRLDWLTLNEEMLAGQYDVVYVIGNSLCHLESLTQVRRALDNFYHVLAPGGVLICDQRNFDYIDRGWDAIKKDPWNRFRFNQRSEPVMYYGRSLLGAPVERRKGRIIFEYANVVRDGAGRVVPEHTVGELSMLPLGNEDLRKAMSRAGFGEIETYTDLTLAVDDAALGEADWLTFVGTKPVAVAGTGSLRAAATPTRSA